MRIIELDPADTFASARDRVLRGERGRVALVAPHGLAWGSVELVLLRRLADRERLPIGLVTGDRELARRARGAGLPTFASLTLAEHFRPGWRKRNYELGIRNYELRGGRESRSNRAEMVLGLLVGVVGLFLVVVLAALVLPRAEITLRAATQPVQVIAEVTADPALDAPDATRRAVPAREVRLSVPWEATGAGNDAAARRATRALALQGLGTAAPELLSARLDPGLLLVPASVGVAVADEAFAVQDGDTRVTMQADLVGLTVAEADVAALLAGDLTAALPAGLALDPATVRVWLDAAATSGRFQATAQATGRGQIDAAALPARLTGQPLNAAAATLNTLPLAEPPQFDVWPSWWLSWFGRLPLRADNITIRLSQ